MPWAKRVKEAGGRVLRNSDTQPIMYDGQDYHYETIWNESEEIEAFLDKHADEIVKSDETMVGTYLTLFFSVK